MLVQLVNISQPLKWFGIVYHGSVSQSKGVKEGILSMKQPINIRLERPVLYSQRQFFKALQTP